jgi:hypothetical protein
VLLLLMELVEVFIFCNGWVRRGASLQNTLKVRQYVHTRVLDKIQRASYRVGA